MTQIPVQKETKLTIQGSPDALPVSHPPRAARSGCACPASLRLSSPLPDEPSCYFPSSWKGLQTPRSPKSADPFLRLVSSLQSQTLVSIPATAGGGEGLPRSKLGGQVAPLSNIIHLNPLLLESKPAPQPCVHGHHDLALLPSAFLTLHPPLQP